MYLHALKTALLLSLAIVAAPAFAATAPADTPGVQDLIRDRQDRLLEEQRRRLDELKELPGKLATPVRPRLLRTHAVSLSAVSSSKVPIPCRLPNATR